MQLKTIFGVLALASMGFTSPTPNPDVEDFEERDLEERQFGDKKLYCCANKINKDLTILWIKVAGVGLDCVKSPNSDCGTKKKVKCYSNFPYEPKNQVCNSFG
ncbi:hypothetical protein BP00DRAFT_448120 [Aspergillus indologenus CBS 114.80]|uniref:Uncharacterized protein n=1 Tax=Aspergillus indologenus CBS 114.80 TaxID=1450541 RepID=A0A2V5I6F7_9EURO|nr:hypothetical protein BP00DRAFT_448120 [Aspergillus indologenus CBS 114.80]